jgi:hypothetical protein
MPTKQDTAAKIAAEATAAQFLAVFLRVADTGGYYTGKGKAKKLCLGETVTDTGIISRGQWLKEFMATELQRNWTLIDPPKPKRKARK